MYPVLTDALRILYELGEKPIMLVIDEAQHALTTENGLNAMFAIKSARDQRNTSSKNTSLMMVFTGSGIIANPFLLVWLNDKKEIKQQLNNKVNFFILNGLLKVIS